MCLRAIASAAFKMSGFGGSAYCTKQKKKTQMQQLHLQYSFFSASASAHKFNKQQDKPQW